MVKKGCESGENHGDDFGDVGNYKTEESQDYALGLIEGKESESKTQISWCSRARLQGI